MMTFHSVMESPEPVRRVMPPTMTMAKTRKQPVKSQIMIGFESCLISPVVLNYP